MTINNTKMDNLEVKEAGYFPFEYIVDFLKFLRKNDDIIQIITYNDFPWGDDYDYENNYPSELKNWQKQLSDGSRDRNKIYLLIQHDVDSTPERTTALLREEERLGIPSNIMIFNRRIKRRHLQNTGELVYTDYRLDYDYLRHLQDKAGFVICYHSNAFEQALFDVEKASKIFMEDIDALRRHFDISFFSPHGGARSPEGITNNILPIPDSLRNSLRWVHNRRKVRFDGDYSDGGINSPKMNPEERDLRDFVKMWKKGNRYRILLHPQYYNSSPKQSPRMAGTLWYDNLLEFYAADNKMSAWDDVKLEGFRDTLKGSISQKIFSFRNLLRRLYVRR